MIPTDPWADCVLRKSIGKTAESLWKLLLKLCYIDENNDLKDMEGKKKKQKETWRYHGFLAFPKRCIIQPVMVQILTVTPTGSAFYWEKTMPEDSSRSHEYHTEESAPPESMEPMVFICFQTTCSGSKS